MFERGSPIFFLPISSRGRDSVDLIYESLCSLFAIQQEQPCERPFVGTCQLPLEMMPEEGETGSPCRDGVRPGAPWTRAGGQEPRGPGLAAEPLGSASPSLPARRRGDHARACAAELGSRHHRPLGFSAGELTAPWTAARVVASVRVAKHTFLVACGLRSWPKKQCVKNFLKNTITSVLS